MGAPPRRSSRFGASPRRPHRPARIRFCPLVAFVFTTDAPAARSVGRDRSTQSPDSVPAVRPGCDVPRPEGGGWQRAKV
jgi:hypothetical protein